MREAIKDQPADFDLTDRESGDGHRSIRIRSRRRPWRGAGSQAASTPEEQLRRVCVVDADGRLTGKMGGLPAETKFREPCNRLFDPLVINRSADQIDPDTSRSRQRHQVRRQFARCPQSRRRRGCEVGAARVDRCFELRPLEADRPQRRATERRECRFDPSFEIIGDDRRTESPREHEQFARGIDVQWIDPNPGKRRGKALCDCGTRCDIATSSALRGEQRETNGVGCAGRNDHVGVTAANRDPHAHSTGGSAP